MSRTAAMAIVALGVLMLGVTHVSSAPPAPPGGHIPVYYGGANQGGYPPVSAGIADPALGQAPALAEVSSAPNPFRGSTAIRFALPAGAEAKVRIFDLAGREVREIAHRAAAAGRQEVVWDGRNSSGKALASGVYFFEVSAGKTAVTHKLVLLQ